MKPFTFSQLLLLQRVDEALRLERQKDTRNLRFLTQLQRRRRLIAERLNRSFATPALAGS